MNENESSLELVRVLAEAGERETLFEWMAGEARQIADELERMLADPDATSAERAYAAFMRTRFAEMFAELREITEEPEEQQP
jgi:hypothetical protein